MSESVTNKPAQIILASASPRRRELLQQIGLAVKAQSVDIDESQADGEPVIVFVERLAMEKAQRGFNIISNEGNLPVLGSDTIVEIAGQVLGKPEDRQHAKRMLQKLSGQKHTVHTSVAIVTEEGNFLQTNSSQVTFKVLGADEIDSYLTTGEADDKAGAYAIQGIAAQFVLRLDGSFSGVMGLPLYETVQLLKQCGLNPLAPATGSHI